MRLKTTVALLVTLLLLWLVLSPAGKPADDVRTVGLSGEFGVQRHGFSSRSNARGLPHLPRSLTLTASEGRFHAYLLDLSAVSDPAEKVRIAMAATAAIERGSPPPATGLVWSANGVAQAGTRLHRWPWGVADYVLILHAEEHAEVEVRISFGAQAAGPR